MHYICASLVPSANDRKPALGAVATHAKLRNQIAKLARSQAPVYISGESGSGKELVARQIHLKGARAKHPFIPVNCGAIPAELMESEFFGHKKAALPAPLMINPGFFKPHRVAPCF